MLGQRISATGTKTPIRLASGPSTDASSRPVGNEAGDHEAILREMQKMMADRAAQDDPYRAICDELYALLNRKRGYYGCLHDPLENALSVEDDGIPAWQYQAARIGEKTRRLRGPLQTLKRVETLLDIAGHAVVAIACERRKESQYERQVCHPPVAAEQQHGTA